MSLQPCRSLSLAYFFLLFFFVLHIKSHATYIHDLILYELMENYILIYNFFLKNIVSFSMLLNCHVILPHPPHNIVICTIPLEFQILNILSFQEQQVVWTLTQKVTVLQELNVKDKRNKQFLGVIINIKIMRLQSLLQAQVQASSMHEFSGTITLRWCLAPWWLLRLV